MGSVKNENGVEGGYFRVKTWTEEDAYIGSKGFSVGAKRHLAGIEFVKVAFGREFSGSKGVERIVYDPKTDPNGTKAKAKLRPRMKRLQAHYDRTGERLDIRKTRKIA